MVAYSNITISAPNGTSQHGRPELLCYPSTWKTVTLFFLVNYVAHCFTTWRRPGEKTREYLFSAFLALIFPVTGLGRGLDAIYRHASWQGSFEGFVKGVMGFGNMKYELQKAGKAGALCVLARRHRYSKAEKEHLNNSNDQFEHNYASWDLPKAFISGTLLGSPNELVDISVATDAKLLGEQGDLLWTREISGAVMLSHGSPYRIVELPASSTAHLCLVKGQELQESDYENHKDPNFAFVQSSNAFQILLAIFQILYSSYTLARRTGDQFQLFGFSSFGITVIPYLTMSFINLLGNFLTPSYPGLYLVKTSVMEEAQSRGSLFQGHVTSLEDEHLYQVKQVDGQPHRDEEHGKDKSPPQEKFKVIPCHLPRPRTKPRDVAADSTLSSQDSSTSPALETEELQTIRVCFCNRNAGRRRWCRGIPTSSITVCSGDPSTPIRPSQILFFFFGWLLAIMAPLPLMVYHGNTKSDKGNSFQKGTIILWILANDLLGTWMLLVDSSLSLVLYQWQKLPQGFKKLVSGKTMVDFDDDATHFRHEWFACSLWVVMLCIGLAVAGMNFHTVTTQILAFGDCIDMPT